MKLAKRNLSIDLLRTIGLLCIILAHVSPPGIIFQIRNFDVVLMVFISGMSFSLGKGGKQGDYIAYFIRRFKRLIIPTWIFLTIYFCIFKILGYESSIHTYITSYSLVSGIGYVWIIRIYFFMAIFAPIFWNNLKKFGVKKYLTIFAIIFFLYDVTYVLFGMTDFMMIIPYVIGYGFVFSIGMCISEFKEKHIVIIEVIMIIVFIVFLFVNQFQSTQIAKYPPRTYYLLYGLIVTLFLYVIADKGFMEKIKKNVCVLWISKNSLWIYLWHIIPLKLLDIDLITLENDNFIVRYVVVVIVSVIITIIQIRLVNLVKEISSKYAWLTFK